MTKNVTKVRKKNDNRMARNVEVRFGRRQASAVVDRRNEAARRNGEEGEKQSPLVEIEEAKRR